MRDRSAPLSPTERRCHRAGERVRAEAKWIAHADDLLLAHAPKIRRVAKFLRLIQHRRDERRNDSGRAPGAVRLGLRRGFRPEELAE